ncbi:MAG: PAS domain-containing protein [Candidatus Accumulibacter phosphatis]|uniref:PAS domain-containing protein n=1 Tax=Candidatus Accumulibacter phosphatis TaxID=327160 RepID=UPI001A55C003|nr:PAS domain-containing protein [Candidatus Accumulibacter phosphatis]
MKNEIWRILVIDDNPDDRADLRQMLLRGSDRRYRFSEAELGAEGVRKVHDRQDGPYDCVLLDYALPDMNAEEVLAALRNGAELPACPVVVVTGSGRADGKMLLRAGAQDYIGKDWTTPASITRAVENSIERFALLADRERTREVLRIERERLDLALRYGDMGIYEWNMVDDRLWWSAEVYRLFGVIPETFTPTQNTFTALVHPDDRESVRRQVLESIARRQPLEHEFRVVHPDGTVRWIADRGQTEYNAEGRGVRHYGVAFDISERRQVEEALREREHFLQRIADVTPGVIHVFDLEEERSVYVNRPVAALLGYDPDEIAAMGSEVVPRLMHPDDRPLFEQHLARVRELTDSEFASLEYRMCDRAGEWHWFHSRDAVFARDAGGVRQIVGSAIDISDRKAAEAKLLEAKVAAEAANRAKSDFLSSMTHELRTPLHAILGFAQLLDAGTPPPTIAQKRSIDQVLKAGWHLLGLINEVLDLALIESGKLSLSMQAVSLAEVLHDCRTMVEPQAEQRGIRISFAPIDAACRVDADPTRLKQVIINLLANAIKYNKLGGTVGVTCSASPPGAIRISVQDTGEGLAPEQVAQLFQPFQRLEHKAMGEEGTGIGLVVCKRLIDLMKGKIGVDSALAKGSVFWIELNLTAAAQAAGDAGEPTLPAPAPFHGDAPLHTLLYIEDDPANLMLVEEITLRRKDVRLLSARNANQGIKLARSFLPDVILMDITPPDISGVRALRVLAEDPATAHIPVLALSANAIPRDIENAEKAGFFRYLTKPIQVDEFMGTLDVALGLAKKEVARAAEQEEA